MSNHWDEQAIKDRLHTAKTIYTHSSKTDKDVIGILRELKTND